MKLSEFWLREWVDPPLDIRQVAERLTMAGLEVEAIAPAAAPFGGVVVGRVLEVAPHPNADRLRVCRVDVGGPEPLTIVCGAPNVTVGMRAPLARIGATLPGGTTLAKSRLRGVESHGMLCSAAELGLGEGGEGLMPLDADATPGMDLRAYLALDDVVIDISLTPNRGDCLGVEGVAREVAALCVTPLRAPEWAPVAAVGDETRAIELAAPEACPRYLGRVIRGIDPAARTPLWLRERLRRSGLRSHGPVIDVTNYVLLELGQPMHAFDLDRLQGGIRVRHAGEGEAVELLDGQRAVLDSDMLVIADDRGAVALAGIMGGSGSAIGTNTRSIFLECAFFAPAAIAGRARRLGLQTDSSFRFERGVDPTLQARAMERATALIVQIAGGAAGPVIEAVSPRHLPARFPIRLRARRLDSVLGIALDGQEAAAILGRLGMGVTERRAGEWEVVPPSFRFDLALEADLIEEIARVRGYENILPSRPRSPQVIEGGDRRQERETAARHLLACRGYHEAITFSFVAEEEQRLFEPDATPLRLANPIAADLAVMRDSLWPGLTQAALHNLKRQQSRIRLFESGVKFHYQADILKEENVIAGIVVGDAWEEQWGLPARPVDFFDVKGDVEALLRLIGGPGPYRFASGRRAALHPGRTARIEDEVGQEIGWLGVLHPELAARLDLPASTVLFEVLPDRIPPAATPAFAEPSRFPAVRRDLALIVDQSVAAESILENVRQAAGPLLQGLSLFDIYQGKGVDSGKKSVALGLTFQDFSRTLTDTEIGVLTAAVIERLRDKLGASLRE